MSGTVGALTDEKNGADAAYAAEHFEALKPEFVKVLTPYDPSGDREMDRRQAARLARMPGRADRRARPRGSRLSCCTFALDGCAPPG
jgi:hypothetical protein